MGLGLFFFSLCDLACLPVWICDPDFFSDLEMHFGEVVISKRFARLVASAHRNR